MESLDPANLASVNKSFNKPGEYATVLARLARRNAYAITSFIFGLDHDSPGVADRTLAHSYSPAATIRAIESIADEPVPYKISHLIVRRFFRGIYFPPGGAWGWVKLIVQDRASVFRLVRESFTRWHGANKSRARLEFELGLPRREDCGDV